MKEESLARAKAAGAIEAEAVAACFQRMDWAAFSAAVELLIRAPRIAASGCGHSGIACRHLSHLLCCADRPARFLSPAEATHGGMGFLEAGDLLVVASRGGKTKELLPIEEIARKRGAKIVAVTEAMNSPLAAAADVAVPMYVTRECDRYDSQGTSSFVVLSAIFDAMQAALIEETGYQNEQFALIHPGGAVGERLGGGKEKRDTNIVY